MSRMLRFLGSSFLAFLFLTSCSKAGLQKVGSLDKTMPTSMIDMSATATSTATLTPTAAPIPPINITTCSNHKDCLEVVSIFDLENVEIDWDVVNPVEIPASQVMWLGTQFYFGTEEIMEQNISHLKWFFRIDGTDYFKESWLEQIVLEPGEDASVFSPGERWGVVVEGWKPGESHLIEYGYVVQGDMVSGMNSYDDGYVSQWSFMINPQEPATATPISTATNTPAPVRNTPRPTALPACEVNAQISIDNTTGGIVTLILTGPATFSFDLKTGASSLDVCSGTYQYQAWGCGGATDSGTINSGQAHEFYCQ